MNARSEPLLWLQLIGFGVLPLEALLLLLLLAGSDPGPVPALERLLCWGLGGLLPALGLWRRPADVWSLLLLQAPLRARRPQQQRLSALQDTAALKLGLGVGSALLLVLLWWSDNHAAIAGPFSPLSASPRLVALLLAALLLALMLWQWQQLLQSLWLLSRSPEAIAAATPMTTRELEGKRLCLGLPLLLVSPLAESLSDSRSQPRRGQPLSSASSSIEALAVSAASPDQPAATGQGEECPDNATTPVPAEPQRTAADPPPLASEEGADAATAPGEAAAQAEHGAPAFRLASQPAPTTSPDLASNRVPQPEPVPTEASPGELSLRLASAAATGGSEAVEPTEPTPSNANLVPPLSVLDAEAISAAEPLGSASSAASDTSPGDAEPVASARLAIAIEPEQGAEEGEGGDLDQQIG